MLAHPILQLCIFESLLISCSLKKNLKDELYFRFFFCCCCSPLTMIFRYVQLKLHNIILGQQVRLNTISHYDYDDGYYHFFFGILRYIDYYKHEHIKVNVNSLLYA